MTGSIIVATLAVATISSQELTSRWNGPVSEEDRYTTTAPFIYTIGYGDWLAEEVLVTALEKAPPDLLHINQPIPINCNLGLTEGFWDFHPKVLTKDEYSEKVRRTKKYVRDLRATGSTLVIPYVNTCIMLGDHEKRTGFWEFYDAWDQLGWLNLGPKSIRDPVLWCGVPRRSLDPYKPYPEYPYWRYEPSAADPDWRNFQRRCVEELAACGYDGVFADDSIMESRSSIDQKRFAEFLSNRPSREILDGTVTLGSPGEGLLYAETVRYWQESMAEHLAAMQEAGRRHKEDFFVVPNWGSISRPLGLVGRERSGKSLEAWSRVSRLIMLEEGTGPGCIAPGAIHDYALQFKQCLAYGVIPALLPYLQTRLPGELAYAEIAASGGGAFLEPTSNLLEVRKIYRDFFHSNGHLLEGLHPWSQVALLYDTDEAHYEHDIHISDSMKVGRALLDSHVQFDVILKEDFTNGRLFRYETLVLPNVSRLSDRACEELQRYVREGGHLLATGEIATHDELNRERPRHAWGLAPWIIRGMTENDRDAGKGRVTYVADTSRLIPATVVDVEMFSDILSDGIDSTLESLQKHTPTLDGYVHPFWKNFREGYANNYLSTDAPPEVRIHVFNRSDGLLAIHLVHYCVSPWEPNDSLPPKPLKRCKIRVRSSEIQLGADCFGLDAYNGRTEVLISTQGDFTDLTIHDLGFHRMIVSH